MNLDLLREERIKRGITQESLAKSLGFKDKSSYCLIENGKTSVSVDIANKIIATMELPKDTAFSIFFAKEVQETSTDDPILADEGATENVKHST